MLVIITGRSSPSPASLLQEKLQILRNRGINILVIGVGNVDTSLLQAITSDDPAVEDRVLLLKRFDGILQYSQDIVDVACGQGKLLSVSRPEIFCTYIYVYISIHIYMCEGIYIYMYIYIFINIYVYIYESC